MCLPQIKEGEEWLSSNMDAEAEEIREKQKEIEAKCNPVLQQLYQKTGGSAEPEEDVAHDEL